jgi:predicted MPP superfamily phosphohydrolase
LFSLFDSVLFWSLPRTGISFGPWKAQVIVLAIPRAIATCGISFILAWANTTWALIALSTVQIIGLAALIWGTMVEPFRLQLSQLSVKSDRMLKGSETVRLLHISDLHIERLTKREEKLLRLVREADADLILITGDFLNLSYVRDGKAQRDVVRLLSQLSAPYGVYAVQGSPPVDERDVVPPLFDDIHVHLLIGEAKRISLNGGQEITLLGMDCTHYLPDDAAQLQKLVEATPQNSPLILMYHAPDLFPEAADHGLDLYLCGHTHGGQVRLPLLGAILTSSQFGRRYQMGLYRQGRTRMYVSRGVGMEGYSAPRVRFLCPPEITLVTIQGDS